MAVKNSYFGIILILTIHHLYIFSRITDKSDKSGTEKEVKPSKEIVDQDKYKKI